MSPMPATAQSQDIPRRIPSLDGLRAISITLVIIGHLIPALLLPYPSSILALFAVGALGVNIFFVISGFLITSLLLEELDSSGRISLGRFYYQRSLRIFPAYFAFLGVLVILQAKGFFTLGPSDLPHALTYTTNYCIDCTWQVIHSWSLADEEQFYLMWPAALLLLGKRRGMILAGFLLLLCPFIRWLYLTVPGLIMANFGRFETVADSLAVGCLLAGVRPWLERQRLYLRVLTSPAALLAPIITLLVYLVAQKPSIMPYTVYALIGISLQNVLIGISIHTSMLNSSSPIGRFLNAKPVMIIGVMSYSIYLWQQIFLNSTTPLWRFPATFAFIALASSASYFLIEKPFIKLRQTLGRYLFPSSPALIMLSVNQNRSSVSPTSSSSNT